MHAGMYIKNTLYFAQ